MGSPHAPPSYQGTEKSCLIRFIVTFFISSNERPAAAEARCVLNIDLSADPGIEKSSAQWNEAEKQHIKNHQMKRLLCLSELLCVLRPLGVSVFLWEELRNPPTASQLQCKQTRTQVSSPWPLSHRPFDMHMYCKSYCLSPSQIPPPLASSFVSHHPATAVCNRAMIFLQASNKRWLTSSIWTKHRCPAD